MSERTDEVSAWSTLGYVIIAAVMVLLHLNVSYEIFDFGSWFPLRTTAEYDRVVLRNSKLEARCAKLEKFMPVLCQQLDPTGVLVLQFKAAMELQDPDSNDSPTEKGQKGKGLLTCVLAAFNGLKIFFVDVKNFFERNKPPSADRNGNEPDPGPQGPQDSIPMDPLAGGSEPSASNPQDSVLKESPSQDSVPNGSGSAGPVSNDPGSAASSPQEPTTSATGNKEPDTEESGVNEAGPKKFVAEASVAKVSDSEEPVPKE